MVTGESVHYVAGGGSITPRLADDVLYRKAHPEPVKKPSGLDWDAHTPSCSSCSAKSGQIDGTGLCPTCRGDKAVNPIHTEIGSNRHGNFQQLDADEVTKRFTAPTQAPESTIQLDGWRIDHLPGMRITSPYAAHDPNCPDGPHPTRDCRCKVFRTIADARDYIREQTIPQEAQTPQAADPAPTDIPTVVEPAPIPAAALPAAPRPAAPVRAKVRRTTPHEVVITLCSTADPIDPVAVAALLTDLLTALTTQTPAAAPRPSPVTGAAAGPKSEGRRPVGKQARPSDTPHERGPRRDKINLPHHEIAQAYAAGASLRELADRYDVSSPTIARHLDEQNVVRRKQKVDYTPELIEQVRALYVDEALSQDQAAERLGVSLKIVQTAMTRGNILARESAIERSQRGIGHPIKLQPADQQNIVDAYQAGERASVIADRHGITTATLYHCLDKHRIPRHGRRAPGLGGADHARALKDQLATMTATSREIKQWALAQGLVDHIARGIPPRSLVDAYAAAHPTTHQEAS